MPRPQMRRTHGPLPRRKSSREAGLSAGDDPNHVTGRIAHAAAETCCARCSSTTSATTSSTSRVAQRSRSAATRATLADAQGLVIADRDSIPSRLHSFRASHRCGPGLAAARRGRCSSWRFGAVEFRYRGVRSARERRASNALRAPPNQRRVDEADRLRQDALGALTAVSHPDSADPTGAEGFERAATGLAAALAGPGLLFAA